MLPEAQLFTTLKGELTVGKREEEKHARKKLFGNINQLRKGETQKEINEREESEKLNLFSEHTCCGRIARNKYFEYITLLVIVFNALYLGYDADYSARYDKPDDLYSSAMPVGFPLMENLFCIFFTVELLIRFFGYKKKSLFITDIPFLFDLVLVLLMVAETWPLAIAGSGGAFSQLSILRLLRLVRIARMGKLLRYFPELQLLVRGMAAAIRSVGCASILLLLVLYVFAIVFTSEYHQGWRSDNDVGDDDVAFYFGSMGKSMRHLLIMGTILDDITAGMNVIRSSNKMGMVLAFLVLVVISAFTLFNMLLGILCEVVQATGAGEKAKEKDKRLRETISSFFRAMDVDGNGKITRSEFARMHDHPSVMQVLSDLDIDGEKLDDYSELFFGADEVDDPGDEKTMTSSDAVAMIMKLRPGKGVNCCDFNYFKKKVTDKNNDIKRYIDCIEWMVAELVPESDGESDDEGRKTEVRSISEASRPRAPKKNAEKLIGEMANSAVAEAACAPASVESSRRWQHNQHVPESYEMVNQRLRVLQEKKRSNNAFVRSEIQNQNNLQLVAYNPDDLPSPPNIYPLHPALPPQVALTEEELRDSRRHADSSNHRRSKVTVEQMAESVIVEAATPPRLPEGSRKWQHQAPREGQFPKSPNADELSPWPPFEYEYARSQCIEPGSDEMVIARLDALEESRRLKNDMIRTNIMQDTQMSPSNKHQLDTNSHQHIGRLPCLGVLHADADQNEARRPTIGDHVKILPRGQAPGAARGLCGRIIEDDKSLYRPFKVELPSGQTMWYSEDWVKLITDAELAKAAEDMRFVAEAAPKNVEKQGLVAEAATLKHAEEERIAAESKEEEARFEYDH
jgi:hypothetical protein